MNYYRFPENRITKVGFGLYLFVMLYLCRNSMFTQSVVGFYPSVAITLGVTAVLGVAFLALWRKELNKVFRDGRILFAVLSAAVMLLPMVLKRDWQFMYVSMAVHILTAIFLTYFVSWRQVAKYYVAIVTVLGIYSLFAAYLFRIPLDMGILEMEVFRNPNNVGFYNFIFSVVPRSYVTTRNFGIFREPGVYQYYILLALFLTQYGVQWKKQWQMWAVTAILSVVMLSTLATGGVAELGLLALYVFLDKKLYRNKILVAIVLVALVLVVAYLYYCYWTFNEVWIQFAMMTYYKFTAQVDSVTERSDSIQMNLDTIRNHPLLGDKLANVLHGVVNNTSSSLILFAAFGILFGAFHALAWGVLVWRKEKNILWNLCLLGILFLSFNTQNLTGDFFFWLFPVMALTEAVVPKMGRKA